MTAAEFSQQLDSRIAKYDLLCHPFYKAWSAGELTRRDLCEYAKDYYHHVEAFPTYLAELAVRLDEGELRQAVLSNLTDEKGSADATGETSHAELWLDFAEGMGADHNFASRIPLTEVKALMNFFHDTASLGSVAEALASFYAYESQVPRVAREKARGLKELYGADEKTTTYFKLHTTADVFHSEVWKQQLMKLVEENPKAADKALSAGENAAKALWVALDGIESRRMAEAA